MAIQTATNPQTGETVALVNGQWVPVGQTATNDRGQKAYLVNNNWIMDEPSDATRKSTIGSEIVRGGKQLASSIRTSAGALTGSPEEAAIAGVARGQAIGEEAGEGASLEAVKRAYQERGLLSAAGEVASQIPRALAGQVPQLALLAGGAKAGAMAGSPLGPAGVIGGGVLGAGATLLPQFFGSNIERQASEQMAKDEQVNIDRGAAGAAAAGQAAIEGAGTAFVLGKRIVKSVLGLADDAALTTAKAQQAMTKAAERSLAAAAGRGIAKGALVEIPVEIASSVLERAQAGLDVTSPEAMAEYGEVAYQAGLVGGAIGAGAGPIDTAMARQGVKARTSFEEAAEQRVADEAEAERQRAEEDQVKTEEVTDEVKDRQPSAEPEYIGQRVVDIPGKRSEWAARLEGGLPMSGGLTDDLAYELRRRREAEAEKVEVPLGDDYAFLQREKQRLLQQDQTPDTRKLLGRIDDQLGTVLKRDIERLRTESETLKMNREADAEAAKTSVFGQDELPPVESRDVVVGNLELGKLQAREAPPVDPLTGRELKGFGKMEGTPQPMVPEIESEVEKLTRDQGLAVTERERLEKRTSGTSLSQVLRGTLRDAELSELGGRARQVGKNPFLNLKAPKGQTGSSMEDMVDTGKLDIFLPVKMRPDSPDYVNSESAEYIRDKLRNNQLYTYETELAIQRVENDIESIERQIQNLLSDNDINKELQYAANEQRELDQAAQEFAPEEAYGDTQQRQAKASDDELGRRQAQLDSEAELSQREAGLLEELKRLEEERLKLESPTKDQVVEDEERKAKATELDEREQVRRESEAGSGQFELTREEGRQDTTGDIFNQPEPAPEPEVVAVSPERERKEALDKLAAAISVQIPSFRAASVNKTRMLKPSPLNPSQKREILRLASDALDLGLPASVLGNVKAAGSTRMDVTAVMSQNGWLMTAKNWSGETRASKLQVLIHELAHAVDTLTGNPSSSAQWNKAHSELEGWYKNSPSKAGHMLSYPFAPQYRGKVRIKMESFAQAFSYYFTAPVDLQNNAPEAYSQIQSIVERIQNESQAARAAGTTKTGTAGIKIQPARSGTDAEVQPSIGAERTDVGGAARLADRGTGEVTAKTDAPAFKRWFGDSKVVDENGEPMVVYHGTKAFDEYGEKEGEAFTQFAGFPNWFAEEPYTASGYAGAEGTIYPVYLSIKKPLSITNFDMNDDAEVAYALARRLGVDIDSLYLPEDAKAYNVVSSPQFVEAAQNAGYDGIKVKEGDYNTYAAFEPNQIKSAIGNIGTYDPEIQEINYSRQNIKGQPVLAKWTTPNDTKLYGEINKDDIIYSLQNKMIDTKRVVDAISASAGKIMAKWNPYLQEELFHGRTAKQTGDFLKKELRPLMQDMSARGVNIEEFEKYLHNRHAEDYNKHVAKINPNLPDGGSGIKTDVARAYLKSLKPKQRADFEALAKRVDAINKATREVLVEGGLETRDLINEWEGAFPFYVPLKREELDYAYTSGGMGTGQGFDVRGNFSRRATGSERNVVDILANTAMQRERAIIKAEKNRVAQAMFGLAAQSPNPDFWLPIDPMAEVDPAAAQDLLSFGLSQKDLDFLMKEPRQKAVDKNSGQVVERINATLRNNENVMSMRFNGRDRYVFFNPNNPRSARMISSLKNLDADQLGYILGNVSKVTRWFASVNTQYNPIFGAYNFLRDVQGAALQLSDTPLAKDRKAVVGGTLPALKGIYSALRAERDGETTNSPWAKLWNEFQSEGGQTGFRDQFSRSQERAEALEKELKMITEGKLKSAGRATLDWLSDYNDSMENAVRLSAYKAALDRGINKQEAASIAKNLTVNFNRKGQIAVQAGALYAFFNAAVQGTTRLAQTLRGPAGKKIMAGGLLLGTMQAALLAAAGFDDEEPPEFVRERNLILPIGGDKYLTFPMPLGYHVIPSTSRIITEWAMSGFKDTPDRIASLTGMFLEAFNPIGNAGWSAQTLAPTFADPIVALTENRDWTGKPIARKDFSNLDPTPGYTRAKDTASWFSTQLAKFLNYASGGTEFKPGTLSPTPDQIDYLIGQVTGGIGREVLKAEQTVTKTATGEELPPYKIPVVGRFYGETKSSAAESGRFYKNLTRLNEHENEIKGRRENREPVADYMKENPEARLAPLARKTYSDIQKLRKRKEQLLERDAPRESIKQVEEMMTKRMQVFNARVEAIKN
jgi:hypothetical protein